MDKSNTCKLCNATTEALDLDGVSLSQCSKCGLISDNIMYDDAFLTDLYSKMYSGNTYYNQHLVEHDMLAEGKKVKLGWHKNVALEIIDKAAKGNKELSVLEFGAGVGVIGSYYKNKNNVKYSGIELDEQATKLAKSKGCNIEQRSITGDDFEAGLYDYVISFEVMEHIVDLKKAINNIKTLLKDDGTLIFSTPNYNRKNNYKDKKIHQEPPPIHINFFTKDNVPKIFDELGMKVKAVYERPYPFASSPKGHWVKTLLGQYNGSTLVAVVTKK